MSGIVPRQGAALGNTIPPADAGSGAAGTADTAARSDHQHPASGGGSSSVEALAVLTALPDFTAPVYDVFASNPGGMIGPAKIAAGSSKVGDQLFAFTDYFMTGSASGQTITVNFLIGGNFIGSTALTLPASFSGVIHAEMRANIRSIGAGGRFAGAASIRALATSGTPFQGFAQDFEDRGIDTTVDQTVEIEIRSSVSGAGYEVLEASAAFNRQKFS